MRTDYYADYYEFENNNWWFVSRRKILSALLRKFLPPENSRREILDAGCGTGINLSLLKEFGNVTGVDYSEEAIRFCRQRQEENARQARLEALPFADASFDLVTALDVLEHIEEDEAALREIARVCKPQGYVLITVPVFPSLWGEHDEINHHVRRYETRRILTMLEGNRFEVEHQSYMNCWLLPAAILWRWWGRLRRWFVKTQNRIARADNMHHHPILNRLLTLIYLSEKPFILSFGLPIGLSLIVLARKK
ncbi:MAG: class I SAM-dependent methyltransferase [Candidatus Omnitrophota bacterium]